MKNGEALKPGEQLASGRVDLGFPDLPIRGVGTYRVDGEVAAQQRLSLDLTVGDEAPVHFDSGLVPAGGEFPLIDAQISVNGMYCFDTAMGVHAGPPSE